MHRLTARALLVIFLVALTAPLLFAVTAPAPHACCVRKPMRGQPEFEAANCREHDCCRIPAVSHCFQFARPAIVNIILSSGRLRSELRLLHRSSKIESSLSARAPPSPAGLANSFFE